MSGDISGCHISRDENETGIERVEARGAAHHPAMHGADPTSKNGLAPDAESAGMEKPGLCGHGSP